MNISLEQLKEQLKIKPSLTGKKDVFVKVPVITDKNQDKIKTDITALTPVLKDLDRSAIEAKLRLNNMIPVADKKNEFFDQTREMDEEDTAVFGEMDPTVGISAKTRTKKITLDEISQLQDEGEFEDATQSRTRMTRKPKEGVAQLPQEEWVNVDSLPLVTRLPQPQPTFSLRVSSYYMENRQKFVNFINSYFQEYRDDILNEKLSISCNDVGKDENPEFKLLIHQKIVRDYLNLFTPYRGLLLYHGLGSGKTCSSIAIAEGMKSVKKVHILTPKSLQRNYIKEIKKCGDPLFRKNQHWTWYPVKKYPDAIKTFSSALGLTEDYIMKRKGVWFMDAQKESNYNKLSAKDLQSLDKQIDEMIQTKYHFIAYNGLKKTAFNAMTNNLELNIFDNSVVVVDEAHNLISRISNKIRKERQGVKNSDDGKMETKPTSTPMQIYELLMRAENAKIVFLTGTPVVNYPNELGILFNILRGYIKTWEITLEPTEGFKATSEKVYGLFSKDRFMDYFEYNKNNVLSATRNPFGFEKNIEKGLNRGVTAIKKANMGAQDPTSFLNDIGQISDTDFLRRTISMLERNGIPVNKYKTRVVLHKALPDKLDDFNQMFMNENKTLKNEMMFKKRIIGLTSYFRSAQEELLPKYDELTDFEVIKIPMSDYQLGVYELSRMAERKEELKKNTKRAKSENNELFEEPSSSYRIFSRLACNFVMPTPPGRPKPIEEKIDESVTNAVAETSKKGSVDSDERDLDDLEGDEIIQRIGDESYSTRIANALKYLEDNASAVLTKEKLQVYSPKFLNILENVSDPDHAGLHLIYSQFRTMEGIGIFKLVLDYNGFTQFKIKKGANGIWDLAIPESERGKPTYALYTGTESEEEREIIRNIYNSNWDQNLPITQTLNEIAANNHMGEIIKVLMITSSGSEGIDLRSTRFVHIMEPYWHPSRTEQVIGRARRICSHKSLPEDMQDVRVFLYLMTITDEQLSGDVSKTLKLKDKSKLRYKVSAEEEKMDYKVVTSDEALFEISNIKGNITSKLTKLIKEAAIDCATYSKRGTKENLQCLNFGEPRVTSFSYVPNASKQPVDSVQSKNTESFTWRGVEYEIRGKTYIYRDMGDDTGYLYDEESYYQALENPSMVPQAIKILEKKDGKVIIKPFHN